MEDELPPGRSGGFSTSLMLVGVLSIGFAALIRFSMAPTVSAQAGKEFPPIEAAGWINGRATDVAKLRGHVLVIDAWAYWCGPCRMATPMLLHLYEKYKDQDVMFVGLTSEGLDGDSFSLSQKFVSTEEIPWLNGYGAIKTLAALHVDGIPQFWVVDRENHIAAHIQGFDPSVAEDLERALIEALAKPAPGK